MSWFLIRGSVHLIPGHPTINAEANLLFQEYQGQAASGEIQFRRWPLRAVSLLVFVLPVTSILTLTSTNVWFIILCTTRSSQRLLNRQRAAVVELLFTKQ